MTYINTLIGMFVGYALVVLLAEALVWRIQPQMDGGVTLVVTSADGNRIARNLFGFEYDGQLYVSSNHWFRRWYTAALAHPEAELIQADETCPVRVVAVAGRERDDLAQAYAMGPVLRFVCGFAPSKFLRLDPRSG